MNTNKEEWEALIQGVRTKSEQLDGAWFDTYYNGDDLKKNLAEIILKAREYKIFEIQKEALDDYRKQLREKVEGMKQIPNRNKKLGLSAKRRYLGKITAHNQALTEVLELINNN